MRLQLGWEISGSRLPLKSWRSTRFGRFSLRLPYWGLDHVAYKAPGEHNHPPYSY